MTTQSPALYIQQAGRVLRPAAWKREQRVENWPTLRASNDRLFVSTATSAMDILKADGGFRPMSEAMVDYVMAKRQKLKAHYFYQRYGRDYWTGTARRARSEAIRMRRAMGDGE